MAAVHQHRQQRPKSFGHVFLSRLAAGTGCYRSSDRDAERVFDIASFPA